MGRHSKSCRCTRPCGCDGAETATSDTVATTPESGPETVDDWVARHLVNAPSWHDLTSAQRDLLRRAFVTAHRRAAVAGDTSPATSPATSTVGGRA